jgi:uncharacterized protein (UPF0212 family)
MEANEITCRGCGAGLRRLELKSVQGERGEYRCPACDTLLETFDGSHLVAYRLTVQPLHLHVVG